MAEVAVVVAIVGVLVAIAIPQLISPMNASSNRGAQSSVMLTYEAQRILTKSLGGYTSNTFALLDHAPELTFNGATDPSTSPLTVSVAIQQGVPASAAAVGLASLSDSGTCWLLLAVPNGTGRGVAYAYDESPGPSNCSGAVALSITQPNTVGAGADWQNAEALQ